MSDPRKKYTINLKSKALEVPYRNVPIEIHKIISIDQTTIDYLIESNQSLLFDIKCKSFFGTIYQDNQTSYFENVPKIKVNSKALNYSLASYKTIQKNKYDRDAVKLRGTNGVLRVEVKPSQIKKFIEKGTITLRDGSGSASYVSLKIGNSKTQTTKELASFLLLEGLYGLKDSDSYTNGTRKDIFEKTNIRTNLSLFSYKNLLNILTTSAFTPQFSSPDNQDEKNSNAPRKPYFLVKLALTHPRFIDTKKTNSQQKEKSKTFHNVPRTYYEGIVGTRMSDLENSDKFNQNEFVSLTSLKDIQWVDINGEKYIPINYPDSYLEEQENKGIIFEEKIYPDQFIMRPYDKGLSLVFLIHNPYTKKWVSGTFPLIDQRKTTIFYDKKNKIWNSTQTDSWGIVNNHNENLGITTGVKSNFSVECLYTEKYTLAVSRGLDRYASAPLIERAVSLIHYIPKNKRKRKIWHEADKIFIQQSTLGLEANKIAQIVKIDLKTKKIIKIFDMNNLVGAPFEVDGDDFRNGSIAVALGPNRCRLDISPKLYSSPTPSETHGIFAGGYRSKDKNHNLSFNY